MEGESCLPKLDVIELRVGVDVGVGHTDELPPGIHTALLQRGVQSFQHSYQGHIVLQVIGVIWEVICGVLRDYCYMLFDWREICIEEH